MKREGTITFNGSPSTKRLKRIIGFVMQVCLTANIRSPAATLLPYSEHMRSIATSLCNWPKPCMTACTLKPSQAQLSGYCTLLFSCKE